MNLFFLILNVNLLRNFNTTGMKKRIVFIFALFLSLTGFRGESKIVEQNNVNYHERVTYAGEALKIINSLGNVMLMKVMTLSLLLQFRQSIMKLHGLKMMSRLKRMIFLNFLLINKLQHYS